MAEERNIKEHIESKGDKKWFLTGKDIKWLVSIIITIIITGSSIMYLWNDRKDVRTELDKTKQSLQEVRDENIGLKTRLSKVEGKQEGTQEAIQLFLKNPPSLMQKQIDNNATSIEEIKRRLHIAPTGSHEIDTSKANGIHRDSNRSIRR